MTDKEVMLVVLNELISIRKNCSSLLNKIEEQRETLEAAITQPDPEPLWIRNREGKLELHAAQKKEWVGLTDEDIAKNIYVEGEFMLPYSFASSIEAKLKEKNNG